MPRKVPRPFEFSWGKGLIVEEATFDGEWNESAIQLLEMEGGYQSVRFCYFDKRGRFQRSPLLLNHEEIDGLRKALDDTPKLKKLITRLVEKPPGRSKRL